MLDLGPRQVSLSECHHRSSRKIIPGVTPGVTPKATPKVTEIRNKLQKTRADQRNPNIRENTRH